MLLLVVALYNYSDTDLTVPDTILDTGTIPVCNDNTTDHKHGYVNRRLVDTGSSVNSRLLYFGVLYRVRSAYAIAYYSILYGVHSAFASCSHLEEVSLHTTYYTARNASL